MKIPKLKKSDPITVEVTVWLCCACGAIIVNLLIADSVEKAQYPTFIGQAGLLAAKRQLIRYLLSRFVRILLPAGAVWLAAMLSALLCREKILPAKPLLRLSLLAMLFFYPFTLVNRTGLEIQCEKNGYRGIRPLKAAALLIDIQKDLNAPVPEPEPYYLGRSSTDCGYTVSGHKGHRSVHHKVQEYMLTDSTNDERVAQIGYSDYQDAEKICSFTVHQVSLYPNSGFIASFDGGEITELNDIESLFTLTFSEEDCILRRTEHPLENKMRQLEMVIEREGRVIGRIGTEKGTEEYFDPTMANTRIWMEMYYNGKTVRVSNIVSIWEEV